MTETAAARRTSRRDEFATKPEQAKSMLERAVQAGCRSGHDRCRLTVNHAIDHVLAWSDFRRLCNQRARDSHYRKRLEPLEGYEPS